MRDGEYYYAPHRRMWGVWQRVIPDASPSGTMTGTFVQDFKTKEEARTFVFKENGWNY
jgi:hypothetical protein